MLSNYVGTPSPTATTTGVGHVDLATTGGSFEALAVTFVLLAAIGLVLLVLARRYKSD